MSNSSLKHPKALPICFLTEMWERFGYMLISTTVIFILIQRFNLDDSRANIIVGSFTAILYITSVLAGQIADKIIGYYRSVILGGIVLVIGYSYLALAQDLFTFCVALGVVCSGTGLLKTNVGSYLGHSYDASDTHRQSGFTIFYVGINIGALVGNIMAGYIYKYLGGSAIFITSAFMLIVGTLTFYFGFKLMNLKLYRREVTIYSWIAAIVLTLIGAIIGVIVIYNPNVSSVFFALVIIFSLFVLFKGAKGSQDFKKALSYLVFLFIAVFFWALYNQLFMSLNLFIERVVDHKILGFISIPTQAFVAFNNITILIGGVFLGILWKKVNILDVYKYLTGMFLLVFMFTTLIVGIHLSGKSTTQLVNGNWVVLSYIILALAELFVSAIGLSLATRLAPKGQVGGYMGLWLVNMGVGGYVAGVIANVAAIPEGVTNIIELKQVYLGSFNIFSIIGVVAFVLTVFAVVLIKKLLGEEA
ncbi:hypothetical protein LO80_09130 [Candidatus Francisella endociliophora]|uniref:Major facilitator superfamily (MFS) profile domain-containing protein n=1 Tax=Candidatus Francisella endociliophora TaxID=653937 RepID=A0A097ERE5_9GAMM|nr:oligopeptide:H+ symporter [Francisella sp. FSC1006]AIT10117.1 hypothetical protein LO80_09130 [Francisella sp. FSC1006]